jgi:hypothetical protein
MMELGTATGIVAGLSFEDEILTHCALGDVIFVLLFNEMSKFQETTVANGNVTFFRLREPIFGDESLD